ncbi:RDD family protein [Nocardioides sp.]|uniref:RDD family protein n=1 Tax=Nocardioides sp. TaxID=35761 RepID=UPI002611E6F4|nr:RDD family protein [Nocardioides sp.]
MEPATKDAFETASWGRRMLALIVDWAVCTLVVVAIIGTEQYGEQGGTSGFIVLGAYVLEAAVFTWLLAGSFGKLVTGLRVVPAGGVWRPINPVRLLARQVLVALVIPPLVFRPDGRGLHDMFAGTATVTKATYVSLIRS